MILQALYDYYQRKAADPESKIAPYGFEWKEIPFLIVIDENGKFINLEDTRDIKEKSKRANTYLLPRAVSRTIKIAPQLLWDKEEYLLGIATEGSAKHTSFKNLILNLPDSVRLDVGVSAVINFYNGNGIESVTNAVNWKDVISAKNPFMTFKLAGEADPIPCRETVKEYVRSMQQESPDDLDCEATDTFLTIKAICLITGKKEIIARTHRKTFINKDANTLVSFQKNSGYDSYGRTQAFNAPISLSAEDAYTTSLKMLLEKGSKNKFNIGGTVFVFWADKATPLENDFSLFFNTPLKDDPDRGIKAITSLLESVRSGKISTEDKVNFFVLGLCPGGGTRIAIRLWKTGTVKDFAGKIAQHFEDLDIIKGRKDPEYFTLFNILTAIVLDYKMDNVPPNLAGAVTDSILDGTPYPQTLQQQCLRRIRAEQHVNRIRAAILKGYLNRANRFYQKNEKEMIQVALDKENTNQGYLCGRLFAVLEKIQEEAQPGINTTIKDRFYGAASSTPTTVFGRLLNLSNHHLAKLHPGRKINFDKMLQDVTANINSQGLPTHLSLDDQSRFAIGYYHQRQDLFTAKADK